MDLLAIFCRSLLSADVWPLVESIAPKAETEYFYGCTVPCRGYQLELAVIRENRLLQILSEE